jgi:hypothetical protein
MLVAGLGALMIDTDNFEKNNTSIYVTKWRWQPIFQ